MGMLTKEDLRQIGEVMDEKLFEVLDVVAKGFTGVQTQIEGLKVDVNGLKQEVTTIKATMVTKDYLDEKLWKLRGDLTGYDRKLENKTDVLIGSLAAHGTLETPDLERLETSRVFPKI